MSDPASNDQKTTEGESSPQAPSVVPAVAINTEENNPLSADQNHGTGKTDNRKHTLLEKIAFVVAVLAAAGTGYQAYVTSDNEARSLRAYIGVVSPPDNNQRINRFFPPEVPTVRLNVRNFGKLRLTRLRTKLALEFALILYPRTTVIRLKANLKKPATP